MHGVACRLPYAWKALAGRLHGGAIHLSPEAGAPGPGSSSSLETMRGPRSRVTALRTVVATRALERRFNLRAPRRLPVPQGDAGSASMRC